MRLLFCDIECTIDAEFLPAQPYLGVRPGIRVGKCLRLCSKKTDAACPRQACFKSLALQSGIALGNENRDHRCMTRSKLPLYFAPAGAQPSPPVPLGAAAARARQLMHPPGILARQDIEPAGTPQHTASPDWPAESPGT